MSRVLVVDDNCDVAHTLSVLLEICGHEVMALDDGLAALFEVQRRLPDAVILDIGLPSLDGIEVATRLRQRYGHAMRLIACTGYSDDCIRRRMTQAGFDVILTKPAPADELIESIGDSRIRRADRARDDRRSDHRAPAYGPGEP
jgi:CheY-like chemotaxis protein